MTFALCYWILMLLWLVWDLHASWPNFGRPSLMLFILLTLLGWRVFGAPIHN